MTLFIPPSKKKSKKETYIVVQYERAKMIKQKCKSYIILHKWTQPHTQIPISKIIRHNQTHCHNLHLWQPIQLHNVRESLYNLRISSWWLREEVSERKRYMFLKIWNETRNNYHLIKCQKMLTSMNEEGEGMGMSACLCECVWKVQLDKCVNLRSCYCNYVQWEKC